MPPKRQPSATPISPLALLVKEWDLDYALGTNESPNDLNIDYILVEGELMLKSMRQHGIISVLDKSYEIATTKGILRANERLRDERNRRFANMFFDIRATCKRTPFAQTNIGSYTAVQIKDVSPTARGATDHQFFYVKTTSGSDGHRANPNTVTINLWPTPATLVLLLKLDPSLFLYDDEILGNDTDNAYDNMRRVLLMWIYLLSHQYAAKNDFKLSRYVFSRKYTPDGRLDRTISLLEVAEFGTSFATHVVYSDFFFPDYFGKYNGQPPDNVKAIATMYVAISKVVILTISPVPMPTDSFSVPAAVLDHPTDSVNADTGNDTHTSSTSGTLWSPDDIEAMAHDLVPSDDDL